MVNLVKHSKVEHYTARSEQSPVISEFAHNVTAKVNGIELNYCTFEKTALDFPGTFASINYCEV